MEAKWTPQYYSKLPVVIQAVQWNGTLSGVGDIAKAFPKLHTASISSYPPNDSVSDWRISTLEGTSYRVSKGDWIIQGVKGEYYPCKPDIFAQTYREERGYPYDRHEHANRDAAASDALSQAAPTLAALLGRLVAYADDDVEWAHKLDAIVEESRAVLKGLGL
jgi:hypothetical protein